MGRWALEKLFVEFYIYWYYPSDSKRSFFSHMKYPLGERIEKEAVLGIIYERQTGVL